MFYCVKGFSGSGSFFYKGITAKEAADHYNYHLLRDRGLVSLGLDFSVDGKSNWTRMRWIRREPPKQVQS